MLVYCLLAENERFELSVACTTPPFQDGALNRSANSPMPYYYTKNTNNVIFFLMLLCLYVFYRLKMYMGLESGLKYISKH
jgi:hypothetical protein